MLHKDESFRQKVGYGFSQIIPRFWISSSRVLAIFSKCKTFQPTSGLSALELLRRRFILTRRCVAPSSGLKHESRQDFATQCRHSKRRSPTIPHWCITNYEGKPTNCKKSMPLQLSSQVVFPQLWGGLSLSAHMIWSLAANTQKPSTHSRGGDILGV